MTHDVENPLRSREAGYAQLLEEGVVGPVPERRLEMVRRIHRLVQTAAQTVTDLLELAHSDGSLHLDYANADLAAIANEVVDDHQGMAREQGVEFTFAGPPTPIVTDPARVRQILANLVTNAIKYTPAGGRVRVSIVNAKGSRTVGDRIGVEVRDTGPGIPTDCVQGSLRNSFACVTRQRPQLTATDLASRSAAASRDSSAVTSPTPMASPAGRCSPSGSPDADGALQLSPGFQPWR